MLDITLDRFVSALAPAALSNRRHHTADTVNAFGWFSRNFDHRYNAEAADAVAEPVVRLLLMKHGSMMCVCRNVVCRIHVQVPVWSASQRVQS